MDLATAFSTVVPAERRVGFKAYDGSSSGLIGAEVVLMAKSVDGVYDDDPKRNPDAVKFDHLTFSEALARGLKVADATAFSLCRDNHLPIIVFDLLREGNIDRAVRGEKIGTLVSDDV